MWLPILNRTQRYIARAAIEEFRGLGWAKEKKPDAVQIMTIHRSKGLEFHTVFVGGMVEDLLLHHRSVFWMKGTPELLWLLFVLRGKVEKVDYMPPLSTSGVVVQSTGPGKATSTYSTAMTNNQNSVTNTHSVGESVQGGVGSAAVLVNTARTSLTPSAAREMKAFFASGTGHPCHFGNGCGDTGHPTHDGAEMRIVYTACEEKWEFCLFMVGRVS